MVDLSTTGTRGLTKTNIKMFGVTILFLSIKIMSITASGTKRIVYENAGIDIVEKKIVSR